MKESFLKVMNRILALGKEIYGDQFRLDKADKPLWHTLYTYFHDSSKSKDLYNLDAGKGLLLIGPIGSGKTSMLRLMSKTIDPKNHFKIISAMDISLSYGENGFETLLKFGKFYTNTNSYAPESRTLCIDDIGAESNINHFGNDVNAIQDILLLRYEAFVNSRIKTHCTTNLSLTELGELYGVRVYSRIIQMFNTILIHEVIADKRWMFK